MYCKMADELIMDLEVEEIEGVNCAKNGRKGIKRLLKIEWKIE